MTALAKQLESCLWERLYHHTDAANTSAIDAVEIGDYKAEPEKVDLPVLIDHLEKALEVARTLEKANGMADESETVLLAE